MGLVSAGQVWLAVGIGAGAAVVTFGLWHGVRAVRFVLLDAFERLAMEIDDALSASLPDLLLDVEE